MSLTSLISKDKAFKNIILELFPKPNNLDKTKNIICPQLINSNGVVGSAFDYLLRFYFQWKYKDNNNVEINKQDVDIFDIGFYNVNIMLKDMELKEKIKINYKNAKDVISQVINNKQWITSDNFFYILIFISNLDSVFRTGYLNHFYHQTWENNIVLKIEELKQLSKILTVLPFKINNSVALNPIFKNIPRLIAAADADLIIDNELLIDIKTTKSLSLTSDIWCQLIGYFFLCKLNGIKIKKMGIFFSRYNYLYEIKVDDYLKKNNIDYFLNTKWMQ